MRFGIVTLPNAGIGPVLAGRAGCLVSVTGYDGERRGFWTGYLMPGAGEPSGFAACGKGCQPVLPDYLPAGPVGQGTPLRSSISI